MRITVKGVPAVLLLVVLAIGFVAYRAFLQTDLTANPEVRRQLELNLQSEIAAARMSDVGAIGAALDQGDTTAARQFANGLMERRVEIGALDMRGSGDDIVVKAEYTLHGPAGPEHLVGYFKYSHSPIAGWRYRRETTVWAWRLAMF